MGRFFVFLTGFFFGGEWVLRVCGVVVVVIGEGLRHARVGGRGQGEVEVAIHIRDRLIVFLPRTARTTRTFF